METETTTKTLNINFQVGEVASLSPHLLIDLRARALGKLLYEGLTRIDEKGLPQLAGAEQVAISEDGLVYTFSLRKHCWSDGTPVTADHYVTAWRQALTHGTDVPRADLFYLIKNGRSAKKGEVDPSSIGVYAPNDETLQVTLEHPSTHFLHLLAHTMFAPIKDPKKETPLFNGPFIIKTWEKGTALSLTKSPTFWNHKNVNIDDIHITFVTDPMTAYYMYEKGEIDWIGDPITPLSKEAIAQLIERQEAFTLPVDRFYWLHFNLTLPVFQSQKIRKALYLSVDREQIAKHIYHGAQPLLTAVHQNMIPLQTEPENLEKAVALFSEGMNELHLSSPPTIILSYAQYANVKSLVEFLKNSWEMALGLTVQLQVNEWAVLRQNLEKGNFEMGGCFESSFYGDPLELFDRFDELGSGNYCQWQNEAFKHILIRIKQERDPNKQIQLLAEAEAIIIQETPFIPLFRLTQIHAHTPELEGYAFDTTGCVDFAYAHL